MKKSVILIAVIVSFLCSGTAYAKPDECNEMEPMFFTGEWEHVDNNDYFSYSCLGKNFYADGSQFFYTVTSKKGSEVVERQNLAVIFSSKVFDSSTKCVQAGDILRLMDKVSVLLKKRTGKNAPLFLVKAALLMQDGDYYVEGLRVSISTKSHVTDMSVSIWK